MRRDLPIRFSDFNDQDVKEISIVVKIDGVAKVFSSRKLYTRLVYGLPGVLYGTPGLVYGGLVESGDFLDNLSIDNSSLSLDQQINPEDGTGTISQMTLSFVDIDQYMTQLCSPGVIVNEIMGKGVEVYAGFKDVAWPQDFFKVFRGYIATVSNQSGRVTFSLSDPNIKARQEILFLGATKLTADIDAVVTTLPVDSTGDMNNYKFSKNLLFQGIDYAATMYYKIEGEYFIRVPSDATPMAGGSIDYAFRAARGTTAAAHAIESDVTECVELYDHPLNMALKVMLSGWGGPFISGLPIQAFNQTGDYTLGEQLYCVVMLDGVDVVRNYGLTTGDSIIITGGINDGMTTFISSFADLNGHTNKLIYVTAGAGIGYVPATEAPTAATIGFRSQFDTYPFGMKLSPLDVDVAQYLFIRNTFMFQAEYVMRFFITANIDNGKDFVETQLLKPIGAYSLTRAGKISVGITKPPLASADLQILTVDNVLNPENINVTRSLNNRKFYNRVYYTYDYDDAGNATNFLRVVNLDSEDLIGLTSILNVDAQGARSALQVENVFNRRAQFIINRYKSGAVTFTVTVLFQVGILVEAGDVVAIRDYGTLQLPSVETGERQMGFKLFEVIRRAIDLKTGRAQLTLSSGIGGESTDRYGVISPSSIIGPGSTATSLFLKVSYGSTFGSFERDKWEQHLGDNILIHSEDFSVSGVCTLVAFDPSNNNKVTITSPGFTPLEDYIIDITNYPSNTDKNDSREYKEVYVFQSPRIPVATGISATQFTVATGLGASFNIGVYIRVHKYDFTSDSGDRLVTAITGDTITCDGMGFTPDNTYLIDLIGFADGGSSYRLI